MRRTPILAAALAAVAVTAGAAHADVTDVIVTTSLPGQLTITGVGSLPTAPIGTSSQTTVGGSGALTGAVLTVNDATGATVGWQVNAKYVDLTAGQLSSIVSAVNATGVTSAVNIGGKNVTVNGDTGALATTNALLGVANAGLSFNNGTLGDSAGRTVLSTTGDGRGVTAFNTSYSLNLPAKTTLANTLYTGSVLYTVSPKPAT